MNTIIKIGTDPYIQIIKVSTRHRINKVSTRHRINKVSTRHRIIQSNKVSVHKLFLRLLIVGLSFWLVIVGLSFGL